MTAVKVNRTEIWIILCILIMSVTDTLQEQSLGWGYPRLRPVLLSSGQNFFEQLGLTFYRSNVDQCGDNPPYHLGKKPVRCDLEGKSTGNPLPERFLHIANCVVPQLTALGESPEISLSQKMPRRPLDHAEIQVFLRIPAVAT